MPKVYQPNNWQIIKVTPKDSTQVPQTSGSVYILNKHQEHISTATMGVLESVQAGNTDFWFYSGELFVENVI